jgi:hypothetical protein
VREVLVAAITVAFAAPKYTALFDATGSKLVPVIVTVVPTGPEVGEKELIAGACAEASKIKAKTPIRSKLRLLTYVDKCSKIKERVFLAFINIPVKGPESRDTNTKGKDRLRLSRRVFISEQVYFLLCSV